MTSGDVTATSLADPTGLGGLVKLTYVRGEEEEEERGAGESQMRAVMRSGLTAILSYSCSREKKAQKTGDTSGDSLLLFGIFYDVNRTREPPPS